MRDEMDPFFLRYFTSETIALGEQKRIIIYIISHNFNIGTESLESGDPANAR